MIEIKKWLNTFMEKLDNTFGDRIVFVGLQGSYGRGEASADSDIDVVVIFDQLDEQTLLRYGDMLDQLPQRQKVCGFVSGRAELLCWDPAELFQFYFDTTPLRGSLEELRGLIGPDAAARAVQTGAGGIYHACVHNILHEKRAEMLKELYKSAVFVVQADCFQRTGEYIKHHRALLDRADPVHREILKTALALREGQAADLLPMSRALFCWAQALLTGEKEKR